MLPPYELDGTGIVPDADVDCCCCCCGRINGVGNGLGVAGLDGIPIKRFGSSSKCFTNEKSPSFDCIRRSLSVGLD